MEPSDGGKQINDKIWVFLKINVGHGTRIQYENVKASDKGHEHFLKSTCNIGDPQSRAPYFNEHSLTVFNLNKALLFLSGGFPFGRASLC